MSDITNELLSKVSALTQVVNQIIANSKSVPELPAQTTLDETSLIAVSRSGNSEKLSIQQIINAAINNNQDQLLSVGSISLLGNDLTISSISGKINNTVQTISTPTTINIPYCSTGLNRIDLIVYNNSNAIIRISGTETAGSIVVAPTLPLGALLVTQISVSDSIIGDPSSLVLGASSYKGEVNLSGPTLVNGSGTTGDFFKIIQSGNYDFGAGNIYLYGGDFIYYDGASYDLLISNSQLELNKFPAASLPLDPTDLILVNQGGNWKKANKTDIGGTGASDQYFIVPIGIAKSTSYVGANGWQTADRNTATLFNDTSPFGAYYNGTIITDARIAKIKLPYDCQIVDGSFQFTHAGTYGTENFRVLGFDISGSSVVGTTTIASASYTQGSSGANGNLGSFSTATLLKGTFITYAVQSVVANTYIAQGIVTLVFKKV